MGEEMAEVLVPVAFGAALAVTVFLVTYRALIDSDRLPEDEALEVAVRRLLCATEIRAVEDLVPDHMARLRVALERVEKVAAMTEPEV